MRVLSIIVSLVIITSLVVCNKNITDVKSYHPTYEQDVHLVEKEQTNETSEISYENLGMNPNSSEDWYKQMEQKLSSYKLSEGGHVRVDYLESTYIAISPGTLANSYLTIEIKEIYEDKDRIIINATYFIPKEKVVVPAFSTPVLYMKIKQTDKDIEIKWNDKK